MKDHLNTSCGTSRASSRLTVLCVALAALAFGQVQDKGAPASKPPLQRAEQPLAKPSTGAVVAGKSQTPSLPAALAQGILEEEGNLNVRAAIRNYQTVVADYDDQRRYAATALFRLGECYRKLGQTNEAQTQYQRVLREFPDQQSLLVLSQQGLAALGVSRVASASGAERAGASAVGAASEEASLLSAQLAGLEQLKGDPEQHARAVLALFPDDDLKHMLLNLPPLREQEAKFRAKPSTKIDMAHEGFHVAVGPGGRAVSLGGRFGTAPPEPDLADAQAALRKQLEFIEQRVEFIVGVQKARLQVLQAAARLPAGERATNADVVAAAALDEQAEELRRIRAMQQNSPDLINATGKNGETLLQGAAAKGQLEVVRFLLDHGAAVNGLKQPELTPLHYAAGNGQLAVVNFLLSRGAKVDVVTVSGVTPLHLAALKGYEHVAKALLEAGASASVLTRSAGSRESPDLSYSLAFGSSPLSLAIANGYARIVELMLDHGTDPNAQTSGGGTLLHSAAGAGQTAIVELLIRRGADVNARDGAGDTPLHLSAGGGHITTTKALLESKADVNAQNKDGATPLLAAARSRKHEAAELLLTAGANPKLAASSSLAPLHLAIASQDPGLTRDLLEHGADPNLRTERRPAAWSTPPNDWSFQGPATPLEMACGLANVGLAKVLLEHGANPNTKPTGSSISLLEFQNVWSNAEFLELLLTFKADPNAADAEGQTVIHFVAQHGSTNSLAVLVEHGANVNARTAAGFTPLHYAAAASRLDLVQALLAAKADPNLTDGQGRTPLEVAKSSGSVASGQIRTLPPRTSGAYVPASPQSPASLPAPASPTEIADALRQAGALEEIPHPDRIEVRRPSARYSAPVFQKGTNDWNRFTLMELIADWYHLISTSQEWRTSDPYDLKSFANKYSHTYGQFPDLAHIVIRRPSGDGRQWTQQRVDLAGALASGKCSDLTLEWGDIVEVPEADHPVNARWSGFSARDLEALQKCLARHIEVKVKGQPHQLTLSLDLRLVPNTDSGYVGADVPFMLRPALLRSGFVLASSDLTRVKINRTDPATGQTREWVLNCAYASNATDLWLRDGDRIEIPDK